MSMDEQVVKKGRPRDESRNQVILDSTLERIAEHGYEAVTMDHIAKAAGVGKATIYRRWKSKQELVVEAISSIKSFEGILEEVDETNGLEQQIKQLLLSSFWSEDPIHQKAMAAIGAVLANHKELEYRLQQDYYRKYRLVFFAILDPYVYPERTVGLETLDLIADIGPSMVYYRAVVTKKPIDEPFIEQIVKKMIMPLLVNE
ncbi:transcriptional regulator, TetR family [Geomicrobium sp. JCM 19038]|nr:transcriptional regulator, TetR family [Geomicrobium sp. JCM 19038]